MKQRNASQKFSPTLGSLICLLINFFLFRIFAWIELESPLVDQLVIGLSHDVLTSVILSSILGVLCLLLRVLRLPEHLYVFLCKLLVGSVCLFVGVVTYVFFEYYLFFSSYLGPLLVGHFLFKLGQLSGSFDSDDLDFSRMAGGMCVWVVFLLASFALQDFFPRVRFALSKYGKSTLLLLCALSGAVFLSANCHIGMRKNFLAHYVSTYLQGYPRLGDYFEEGRASRSRFSECQQQQFYYTDQNYPLYRQVRDKGAGQGSLLAIDSKAKVKPNIVLIFMESFTSYYLFRESDGKRLHPRFEDLTRQGIYFENFYANSVQSIRGEYASLCSIYPNFGEPIYFINPELELICLPHILREKGYRTHFFQSMPLSYDDQNDSISSLGFESYEGLESTRDCKACKSPEESSSYVGWGYKDEVLFDHAVNFLEDNRDTPVFLSFITSTNHHPFEVPEKRFELYPPSSLENRMKNTFYYADYALGQFISDLKRKDLIDDTIVIVTADTATPMGQHNTYTLLSGAYDEYFKIPLLLYSPKYIPEAKRVDDIGSQVDITPTILSMLNFEPEPLPHVGRNLLADSPAECQFSVMTQPYQDRYLIMRQGDYRYSYNFRKNAGELFDLSQDPLEKKAVVGKDDTMQEMHHFAFREVARANKAVRDGRVAQSVK